MCLLHAGVWLGLVGVQSRAETSGHHYNRQPRPTDHTGKAPAHATKQSLVYYLPALDRRCWTGMLTARLLLGSSGGLDSNASHISSALLESAINRGIKDVLAGQGKALSIPSHHEHPQRLPWLPTLGLHTQIIGIIAQSCLVSCFLTGDCPCILTKHSSIQELHQLHQSACLGVKGGEKGRGGGVCGVCQGNHTPVAVIWT